MNLKAPLSIKDCVDQDNPERLTLSSGLSQFQITLQRKSSSQCINPGFPSLYAEISTHHQGWVHVVRTNSEQNTWQVFVDSVKNNSDLYPFYTREATFYDAPLWAYGFLFRDVSFWEGRAHALQVDFEKRKVRWLGGFSWGFEVPLFHLYPRAFTPKALDKVAWKEDWKVLKSSFDGYLDLPLPSP